jgi:hypothetical protein
MLAFVTQLTALSNVGWMEEQNQFILKVKELLRNLTHAGLEIRWVT